MLTTLFFRLRAELGGVMQNRGLISPGSFIPSLLIHCLALPLLGLLQTMQCVINPLHYIFYTTTSMEHHKIAQAELQKTCSRSTAESLPSGCPHVCQCRPPPLLPPPPPPPPPPRLAPPINNPSCCAEENWWYVVVIAVAAVFLFIVIIMCYKAIKRKPLHKEENGTTRAEYAMTLETA